MEAVLACARKCVPPAELPGLLAGWQARLETFQRRRRPRRAGGPVAAAHGDFLDLARRTSAGRARCRRDGGGGQRADAEAGAGVRALRWPCCRDGRGAAHGLEQVEFRVGGLAGWRRSRWPKVASGGELSRISLAIQVLTSRSASVPT